MAFCFRDVLGERTTPAPHNINGLSTLGNLYVYMPPIDITFASPSSIT